MTTDDRRLKDARRDAIPADPPSPRLLVSEAELAEAMTADEPGVDWRHRAAAIFAALAKQQEDRER